MTIDSRSSLYRRLGDGEPVVFDPSTLSPAAGEYLAGRIEVQAEGSREEAVRMTVETAAKYAGASIINLNADVLFDKYPEIRTAVESSMARGDSRGEAMTRLLLNGAREQAKAHEESEATARIRADLGVIFDAFFPSSQPRQQ